METAATWNKTSKRWIFRWLHVAFGIPIVGYVYSPFEQIPSYAPAVRLVFLPAILLTGLWMWQGPTLRRLVARRAAP